MFSTLMFQIYTTDILSEGLLQETIALFLGIPSDAVCLLTTSNLTPEILVYNFRDGSGNRSVVLHLHTSQKLYLVDLHIFDIKPDMVTMPFIRRIETDVVDFLKKNSVFVRINNLFAPIIRGQPDHWPYVISTDERLLHTAVVKDIVKLQSKFQCVRISEDKYCGNVLYLDDDVMFGESDQEAYTRVLLGLETGKPPRNQYEGKEILILGGGDGGVIAELLKHNPKLVEMVEIDEEVIKACRVHMRSCCGDALDTYDGVNKKIIIGDCLEHLHQAIQSNRKYDFIINDLTEFPVNKEDKGWSYNFATENSQVMELSFLALKQSGRYLSRGAGYLGREYWHVYEDDATRLGLNFQAFNSFVPSFYEVYRLYEMWKA